MFTKCSLLEGPGRQGRAQPASATRSVREAEASLARLGLEAIDLYQIHWPIPDEDIEEGWAALAELKDEGLVRHIGVSNFDVEQMRRIQQIAPVESLQPQYSLIERDAEQELLPFAEREGIGVIVYSPMGSGMLSGQDDPRADRAAARGRLAPRRRELQRAAARAQPRLVERVRRVAERMASTAGAVAIAWTLAQPGR